MKKAPIFFNKTKMLVMLTIAILLLASLLSACNNPPSSTENKNNTVEENVYNEKSVTKISNLITAGSISDAQNEFNTLDHFSIKKGSTQMHIAIVTYLNNYLQEDDWLKSDNTINVNLINDFKTIRTILTRLEIDTSATNAITFIDSALKLENYTKWNTFSSLNIPSKIKSIHNDLYNGADLISTAAQQTSYRYREAYAEMAEDYFNSVKTASKSLMTSIASKKDEGMQITYDYLNSMISACSNLSNFQDPPQKYYDNVSRYNAVLERWSSDLKSASNIIEKFPNKVF